MNDAYYTQTGERPDLAALEVNPPEGYIGSRIMPIVPVADKSGTVYYATVTADDTAQTSRSAGAAPSGTQISDSSTSFTCAERVKRGQITPDEAKQMGGIEKADVVGAKWAKRQVMAALETSICAEILGGTASDQFDAAKLISDAQVALQAMRLYEGKTALVGATQTIKKIVQQCLESDVFGPAFARIVSGTSPMVAVEGMNHKSMLAGLAMMLGVDEVLAGDDTIWNATAYAGKFAYCKLDDGTDQLSHKWKPVLGKTFMFMPDGKQPYVIQSVADRVNVNNLYDAYCWYDTTALNTSAFYMVEGVV